MKAIRGMQQRAPELGRLRGGIQTEVKGKPQPEAIDHWRATSPNRDLLGALGGLYGIREPIKSWQDQWEIELDTDSIKVMIPANPLFVAYELWGSGGCQRRCDGVYCSIPVTTPDGGSLEQVDCVCLEEGKEPGQKDACKPTTRLKVVIPEIPGLGVWMMTTGSVFAAQELMGQIDILEAIQPEGAVWADLVLEKRDMKKAWEKFTREFNVPTLRVHASIAEILQGSARAAVTAGEPSATPIAASPPAVEAGQPARPPDDAPARRQPARAAATKPDGTEPF